MTMMTNGELETANGQGEVVNPNVMNEQAVNEETVLNTGATAEEVNVGAPVEEIIETVAAVTPEDPDEKILNAIWESGSTLASTTDLVNAGFDTTRMAQYDFEVGNFKLVRLTLLEPYVISKKH